MSKFLTPLSFLRLKSKGIKRYQFGYPTLFACLVVLFRITLEGKIELDVAQFISEVNSSLSAMVGFYIAALAAIATFQNDILDVPIAGNSLTIKGRHDVEEDLTRRRFLTVLFGYCSFLSMILLPFGVAIRVFYTPNADKISEAANFENEIYVFIPKIIEASICFVYFWLIGSLMITTILGLHYLIDRMHR